MKILLHICCAPCAVFPVESLAGAGHAVRGFFFNPNIQPYQEFERRTQALETLAEQVKLPVIWDRTYDLEGFFRAVAFREAERCRFCYYQRLSAAARVAKAGKFQAFTTTLLYSQYQDHELVREVAQQAGRETGVTFYYQDFRRGWEQGRENAARLGLYRQQYCGCIFSERDRFLPARTRTQGRT
jgi:hypothetical protein